MFSFQSTNFMLLPKGIKSFFERYRQIELSRIEVQYHSNNVNNTKKSCLYLFLCFKYYQFEFIGKKSFLSTETHFNVLSNDIPKFLLNSLSFLLNKIFFFFFHLFLFCSWVFGNFFKKGWSFFWKKNWITY